MKKIGLVAAASAVITLAACTASSTAESANERRLSVVEEKLYGLQKQVQKGRLLAAAHKSATLYTSGFGEFQTVESTVGFVTASLEKLIHTPTVRA